MTTTRRALAATSMATAAAVFATAAFGGAPAPAAATKTVVLKDISFTPATVRIHRGSRVRWVWRDGVSPHNVTFRRGHRHSSTKQRGTYTRRFTKAGVYRYHCTLHPGMDGKVVVG